MVRDMQARAGRACAPLAPMRLQGLRACTAQLFQWDLLGPPMAGLLLNDMPLAWTGAHRAEDLEKGLEYAWFATMEDQRFEAEFMDLWRDDAAYGLPSLILNTTSADTGERLVVSNLRAEGQLTDLPGVEEIAGGPLRLSTATFLSARFPVVSPFAIIDSAHHGRLRLVDGGYFNNSGMASIARLLQAVSPVMATPEFAGRVQPMVLVLANSAAKPPLAGRGPGGSLTDALLEPVSVLQSTGEAHEATYLALAGGLVGQDHILRDLRPRAGSDPVALGWLLSARTRCAMDGMVNSVLNEADASTRIGKALGLAPPGAAAWTSCATPAPGR
jgi:hypothetical protein